MTAISQTIFINPCSQNECVLFCFEFRWFFSYGSNWQLVSIGSGNRLAPKRRQAVTWTNVDQILQTQRDVTMPLCVKQAKNGPILLLQRNFKFFMCYSILTPRQLLLLVPFSSLFVERNHLYYILLKFHCSIPIAHTLEILQSCTKPVIIPDPHRGMLTYTQFVNIVMIYPAIMWQSTSATLQEFKFRCFINRLKFRLKQSVLDWLIDWFNPSMDK